jgi:hypothetical protein
VAKEVLIDCGIQQRRYKRVGLRFRGPRYDLVFKLFSESSGEFVEVVSWSS